jgi:hypothetical protein
MKPRWVVKEFDPLENSPSRFIPRPEQVTIDDLSLKRTKEALYHGIIPAISFSAHTADEVHAF